MGKGPLCPGQHQSSADTAMARLPGDEPRGQLSPGHRPMATRRTAQLPGSCLPPGLCLTPGTCSSEPQLAKEAGSSLAQLLVCSAWPSRRAQGSGAG